MAGKEIDKGQRAVARGLTKVGKSTLQRISGWLEMK
jgi:hypothetical protein